MEDLLPGKLELFSASLSFRALTSAFPEHNWQAWDFARTPRSITQDKNTLQQYLRFLEDKLQIKTMEDWYRVSMDQMKKLGGSHLILKNGGLSNVLRYTS